MVGVVLFVKEAIVSKVICGLYFLDDFRYVAVFVMMWLRMVEYRCIGSCGMKE